MSSVKEIGWHLVTICISQQIQHVRIWLEGAIDNIVPDLDPFAMLDFGQGLLLESHSVAHVCQYQVSATLTLNEIVEGYIKRWGLLNIFPGTKAGLIGKEDLVMKCF